MVHDAGGHYVTCPPLSSVVMAGGDRAPARHARPDPPRPASGPARALYLLAGLVNVGMAYVGLAVPGVPATPFVLAASYCFSKSSPRLGRWLNNSPVLGKFLRDWDEHRGIRRPVKVVAVSVVVVVVTASIVLLGIPVWVKCVMGGLAAVGVCTIVFAVPTIDAEARGQGTGDRGQESERGVYEVFGSEPRSSCRAPHDGTSRGD